jgi:DNA-binding transcriptional ArsR family regulator
MGYQTTLEILADPTRRTLVERLRDGAKPVGELARGLSVSRPAVSKHLRLMKEAGVVRMTEDGTRNLYSLDLRAIEQVRKYLDGFWDDALARFKAEAEKPTRGKGAKR